MISAAFRSLAISSGVFTSRSSWRIRPGSTMARGAFLPVRAAARSSATTRPMRASQAGSWPSRHQSVEVFSTKPGSLASSSAIG